MNKEKAITLLGSMLLSAQASAITAGPSDTDVLSSDERQEVSLNSLLINQPVENVDTEHDIVGYSGNNDNPSERVLAMKYTGIDCILMMSLGGSCN